MYRMCDPDILCIFFYYYLTTKNTLDYKQYNLIHTYWGFPGSSVVKNPPANAGDVGSIPELGRSPEEGNGNTPGLLPGDSHGQWRLVGYSPWGRQESDMTE